MSIETFIWRKTVYQFQRRIDWMNATHTPFGEAKIDHTTLFKFFQRIEQDDTAYKLFKELTSSFIIECGVSTRKQRVDSFFMHGWLKIVAFHGLGTSRLILSETHSSVAHFFHLEKIT